MKTETLPTSIYLNMATGDTGAGHGLGFDSPSDLSAVAFSVCAAG